MHAAEIEKTRHSLEHTKSEELKTQLEDKLRIAATLRDDKIKKILDRLKEHVSLRFCFCVRDKYASSETNSSYSVWRVKTSPHHPVRVE